MPIHSEILSYLVDVRHDLQKNLDPVLHGMPKRYMSCAFCNKISGRGDPPIPRSGRATNEGLLAGIETKTILLTLFDPTS